MGATWSFFIKYHYWKLKENPALFIYPFDQMNYCIQANRQFIISFKNIFPFPNHPSIFAGFQKINKTYEQYYLDCPDSRDCGTDCYGYQIRLGI